MISKYIFKEKGIICPVCHSNELSLLEKSDKQSVCCKKCDSVYELLGDSIMMIPPEQNQSGSKKDIQKFWKHLYHAAYDSHKNLDKQEFLIQLDELEELFKARSHLATTEMPIDELKGKKILEIGSGAGAHSSLFCKNGGAVTSVDITVDRVIATQQKLEMVESDNRCVAIQADAENLPFESNYFDIVYSNGVLHHTPDTNKAIKEVYRVLKPGGKAIIMLYAKHSYLYWVNIFLLRGILQGNIFKGKSWLGKVTEWMSSDKQKIYNPETKVYTVADIYKLFEDFPAVSVRKSSFHFIHVPFVGKPISRVLGKITGINKAGTLIYDSPWRCETGLELWLGKYIGFNLNILAIKTEEGCM